MGDHVFLKVMPKRGVVRFSKKGKLELRYIEPFGILERVGTVAYRLALPPSLSGVHEVFHVSMLWKYTPDPAHIVDCGEITVDTNGTFEEGLVRILDIRDQVLRRKTVRLMKVLSDTKEWRRQLGNARTRCRPPILSYLRMKVRGLIFGTRILLHMHVFVCTSMCEFRERNSVKGGRM